MRTTLAIAGSLILGTTIMEAQRGAEQAAPLPTSPIVLTVGCAQPGQQPHIWQLTNAGERTVSPQPAISEEEKATASGLPLGSNVYELVGIADFVSSDAALKIGDRNKVLTPDRANTTGLLTAGHKVAVKGLYIAGKPARINVTSVVSLAPVCP